MKKWLAIISLIIGVGWLVWLSYAWLSDDQTWLMPPDFLSFLAYYDLLIIGGWALLLIGWRALSPQLQERPRETLRFALIAVVVANLITIVVAAT